MSAREQPGLSAYDAGTIARGVAVRCALRGSGPEVRVVVRGGYAIPQQVDVYAPPDSIGPMQTLALDNEQPAYRDGDLLVGGDLNGDGWTDLRVQTWSGSAGVSHDVFMWNSQRSRFEQDSVLRGGTGLFRFEGRPCVGQESWSGIGSVGGGEYCWARGGWHWVRSWTLEQTRDRRGEPGPFYVRTTQWRAEGRVVRTQIDSLPERAAREDPELRTTPPVAASPRPSRKASG